MSNVKIQASAIFACILWASAFMGGKYALAFIPPLHLAGLRLMIASCLLLLFLRINPFKGLSGYYGWVALLSLFQTVIVFCTFNLGLNLVPGSFGAIIIGASPAVSALVAVLILKDEHMTLRKGFGLFLGLLGVVVLTLSREPWTEAGLHEFMGVGLLMICNFSSAFGYVIIKKRLQGLPPLSVNFVQTFFGGLVVFVLAFVFEPMGKVVYTVPLVLSVLFLASITAIAVSLWMVILMQPQVRISTISMWKFLIPSLGAVLSWIFIPDDKPSLLMVFVILAIVFAVVFTVSNPEKQ
ncbi:DMT family transporter [uncultured Sphaerochaeta sp.]|uniref:DMT family transporter n=1 Tax=uncultured Sphaerochaeta sp. TaxID=886478 RepID=UPI002A0A3FDC|nr:DMT family transporter [uncultured Sphaerochaeta sp.]